MKEMFKVRKNFIIILSAIMLPIIIFILWAFFEIPFSRVDTSDWKTYRSEEYGFEFKYPKDKEVEVSENKIQIYSLIESQANPGRKNKISDLLISVEKKCGFGMLSARKIIIDMNIATVHFDNGMLGEQEYIVLKRNGKNFCFNGNERTSWGFQADRNILSTFKFFN